MLNHSNLKKLAALADRIESRRPESLKTASSRRLHDAFDRARNLLTNAGMEFRGNADWPARSGICRI